MLWPYRGLERALEVAAQIAYQADTQVVERSVVLGRQRVEPLGTEEQAALDVATIDGGITSQIAKIGSALESYIGIHICEFAVRRMIDEYRKCFQV